MDLLKYIVEEEVTRRGLRKKDGIIYEPRGPCSYRETAETFKKFLNRVLRGHPQYWAVAGRHDKLMTYLKRSEDGLPTLEVDRKLLAFDNGVLLLPTCEFVRDPASDPRTHGRVAWHHIEGELNIEEEDPQTPLMDQLVLRQMSSEKYEEMLRVFGRLLVEDGWEGWERIPCLRGVTMTGKSCMQQVMVAMGLPPMPVVCPEYRAPRGRKVLVLRWIRRAKEEHHQVFDCTTRVPSGEVNGRLSDHIIRQELPALVLRSLRAFRES